MAATHAALGPAACFASRRTERHRRAARNVACALARSKTPRQETLQDVAQQKLSNLPDIAMAGGTSDQNARLASNGQASSTRRTEPEYDAQDFGFQQPEEEATFGGELAVREELVSCATVEDVLEVLVEESAEVTGSLVVDALLRCVRLAKESASGNPSQAQRQLLAVGRSRALHSMLTFVIDTAAEMSAKDLALCLWALAVMKAKIVRVLRALQKQVELHIAEMNEQDLAMTAWAFASLRHHPGGLLDRLAEAATPKLFNFQPQGLSIILWAYAKLMHSPPAEFSGRVLMRFHEDPDSYSSQSVANIMYALAKLQRSPKKSTCQKVEELIAKQHLRYKDIELANVLFSYAKARYEPVHLIQLIEDRIARRDLNPETASVVWATLVWAAGTLGLRLKPATWTALNSWGLEDPPSFGPVSICNIIWGMAMMGEVRHPSFSKAVATAAEGHAQHVLEPRLMRQLFQAVTTARILGVDLQIPSDLEGTAYKWWRRATMSIPVSLAHDSAAKAVRKLGLECHVQHNAGYGLPLVDIAIHLPQYDLALQVVAPGGHLINTGRHVGKVKHAQQLLEKAGWRVENLEVSQLPSASNAPAVVCFMGKLLRKHGVEVDLERAADAVPKRVPAAISRGAQRNLPSNLGLPSEPGFQQKVSNGRLHPRATNGVNGSSTGGDTPKVASSGRAAYRRREALQSAPESDGREKGRGRAFVNVAEKLALEDGPHLSAEEQALKAAEKEERRAEVAKSLSGDFMEGWVGLGDWKAARKVEPRHIRDQGSS